MGIVEDLAKEAWQQKWTEYETIKKQTQQLIQSNISKRTEKKEHNPSLNYQEEKERLSWKKAERKSKTSVK